MTKPTERKEFVEQFKGTLSPNVFSTKSTRTILSCPSINFVLGFPKKRRTLNLVELPFFWSEGNKIAKIMINSIIPFSFKHSVTS